MVGQENYNPGIWIALYDTDATLGDMTEATAILEDVCRRLRRLFGDAHPQTAKALRSLEVTRADLAERQRVLGDLY